MQSYGCWIHGYNYARSVYNQYYYNKLEWLFESEKWSASEIEAYQNEHLRRLIEEAYENVLYYRELMDQLKLRPSDITTVKDLPKLPTLKKKDIRNNPDKFVSRKTDKRKLMFRHTSGTTGTGLHFYINEETNILQHALWWRHRGRFGMTNDSLHVNFRGNLLVPLDQKVPPYWRWSSPLSQVHMNMQHIIPSKINSIIDFLNEHYFEFYTSFPSIVHVLAITAMEAGLRLKNPPRVIFTGAENVLDFQRRCIGEFTGATITDQYGFSEACANASQCEHGMYHEDFELGIMECIEPESQPGGRVQGRVVGTGLVGCDFPFIRYEIRDIGLWENPTICCPCGRQSRLLVRVEGREDDYVVTPEGLMTMRFDYIFKDVQNCLEAQVVQKKLGEITIYMVKNAAYSEKDEHFIRREIRKWISETLVTEFVYVPEIERGPNGKFRAVKSFLVPSQKLESSQACSWQLKPEPQGDSTNPPPNL
jgi:phenylacetate-CoA ligase